MKNDPSLYWHKLNDYNRIISSHIHEKLPGDYHLSIDDIKSEVNQTYIQLISIYRKGVDESRSMSLPSYCWKYAEHITLNRILAEYRRLKAQVSLDAEIEDDDGCVHHQYGEADLQGYTTLDDHLDHRLAVDTILSRASSVDR